MFILDRSHGDPFEPDLLLRPAFGEFARRVARMPELMQAAALAYFGAPPPGRGVVESSMRLTRGLPNDLFDNGA
jgi:NTE family protein